MQALYWCRNAESAACRAMSHQPLRSICSAKLPDPGYKIHSLLFCPAANQSGEPLLLAYASKEPKFGGKSAVEETYKPENSHVVLWRISSAESADGRNAESADSRASLAFAGQWSNGWGHMTNWSSSCNGELIGVAGTTPSTLDY